MNTAILRLLLFAMPLASCAASPGPEVKIARAMQAFQDSAERFTEARRAITRERRDNLAAMAERAARTQHEVERKTGLWRIVKDTDRLDLFNGLVKEADATLALQNELKAIRAAHEASARAVEARTRRDQKTLADMMKKVYSMGTGQTARERLEDYFQYLSGVANELGAKQPGGGQQQQQQ